MGATRHVGDVDPLLTHRQLDWFFLARLAPIERLQYPTIVDGAFSVTNHEEVLSSKEVASILDSSAKNVSVGSAPRTKAISLRVASANVNTLSPCDDCADGAHFVCNGQNLGFAVSIYSMWPPACWHPGRSHENICSAYVPGIFLPGQSCICEWIPRM